MNTNKRLYLLFEIALGDAGAWVVRATGGDLSRPTPCADWDLGALIGHMIGQNEGFAAAVLEGDAPVSAYRAPDLAGDAIRARWEESAERLRDAFGTAPVTRPVRLAELGLEVPVVVALGMQLLDGAVHAWDVATTLGGDYRPTDEIARAVLDSAQQIAARPGGAPGVFAPPREIDGGDPWVDALRLLGRRA